MKVLKEVKFDSGGLLPVIVQDWKTHEVLMFAYMNQAALEQTLSSGVAHFWSRSRNKLWRKGETSGHIQKTKEIRLDCDGDVLLLKVDQQGGACHMGYRSCFFRSLRGDQFVVDQKKCFDEKAVYGEQESKL
jgi:phosphoribosyl-AMP cyclohydrolase